MLAITPISSSNYLFNPKWVSAFVVAEGSFIVSIRKRAKTNTWLTIALFELPLNLKDFGIFTKLKDLFGSAVGNINSSKSTST